MSKWIEVGEQYIFNSDEIKYYYIDENKENISAFFKDGSCIKLNPNTELEAIRDWGKILKSCYIDPSDWLRRALNELGIDIDSIGEE